MEELLRPITSAQRNAQSSRPFLEEVKVDKPASERQMSLSLSSREECVEALKGEPDYATLVMVLDFVAGGEPGSRSFNMASPDPENAKIIQLLVADIVSNYWAVLTEDEDSTNKSLRRKGVSLRLPLELLLDCLRSIAGVNAILARTRALISASKSEPAGPKRSGIVLNINILLELLSSLLKGQTQISQIWTGATSVLDNPTKQRVLTQELVNLFGGGRIVSLTAEAQHIVETSDKKQSLWLADGAAYCRWLCFNIIHILRRSHSSDEAKFCSDLAARTLRLGHPDSTIKLLVLELLLDFESASNYFVELLRGMPQLDQRKVLYAVLKFLSEEYFNPLEDSGMLAPKDMVSAAASLIHKVIGDNEALRSHLSSWLTSSSGAGIGDGIGNRRAVVCAISQDRDALSTILERSLGQFGDQLYIKHAPILQQEVHAQVLLLVAGYVHRISPIKLTLLLRSSTWLNAISHRLAAPQNRARFLGMVVGESLSELVDKSDKRLDFHMDETDSEEGLWYKSLVQVSDEKGPMDPLLPEKTPSKMPRVAKPALRKPPIRPAASIQTPGFIIEEIENDESEEEDLAPYTKPDSDAEDSDEDAELVNRDKPKPPVYVRDLIIYLRDTENYDRQKVALQVAPTLIRRKADYGTEVKEHVAELATLLVGLQDKFDLEDFDDLRLQGMIAAVVAQPQKMGPWFAKTFFDGDYSLSQRASVLTVLGLSARELAGLEKSKYSSAAAFPSKQLPERIERLYLGTPTTQNQLQSSSPSSLKALPHNALDSITQTITSNFLAPMAAEAADAQTGPDALKLSTFTSRLQQSSGTVTRRQTKQRIRLIPNTTAQLIAQSFFFPLTARFQHAVQSPASRSRGIAFQPFLLSLYLKTLALLLHSAGPSTLSLPEMTSELWALLLGGGVRAHCAGDTVATHAVLFALLALLDVNEDRMRDLCRDNGRQVVETQEWVALVFEATRGDGAGEEGEVKTLAAGILIRLREGMDKYRALLLGDMIGFN